MSSIKFLEKPSFSQSLKPLTKKYRSIFSDIEKLKKDLRKNPLQGADLGNGLRKVRMAIASKNKGKSGGARVITYVEAITANLDGTLVFLYIYDKSEISNIPDSKLRELLESETGME